MNWQSRKLYLATLGVLAFAMTTLWLIAIQVNDTYRAEINRSNIETEMVSIAIEQEVLAALEQVELIQRIAVEKIKPALLNDKPNSTEFERTNELLNRFLNHSKLSSSIGILNADNTILATTTMDNISLGDQLAHLPPLNKPITIHTASNKKSIFIVQQFNHSNDNTNSIFSEIKNKDLKIKTIKFNQNFSAALFDKDLNILSQTSEVPTLNNKKAIHALIQSNKKSIRTTDNANNSSIQMMTRRIGETPLYLIVANQNLDYLNTWKRNTFIYVVGCILMLILSLQIIHSLWRSKRFNQILIQKENKLIASESRFRQMIEAMPIGLVLARMQDHLIMYINQPAAKILDIPQASALSKRVFEFYLDNTDFTSQVNNVSELKTSQSIECILKQNSGKKFWGSISISSVQIAETQTLLISIVDISERKELEAKLKHQATIDYLSGLFNRAHFIFSANDEIQSIETYNKNACLLMLDIDHFKRVNDNYGHDAGDLVIQVIALTCQETLRNIDVVGRLGGEEFAAFLPETSLEEALRVAERLRSAIEQKIIQLKDKQIIRITASIGVTEVTAQDRVIDIALKRADLAMYEAKNKGRNQVQYFQTSP